MNILINGTMLNVVSAYAERENNITLFIHVPQSEIGYDELKTLFKNNTDDIIKTDGETTETFSGFTYANIIDDDDNNVNIVKLTAKEYDFQLGRNRQLEADNTNLQNAVVSKDSEISTLNNTISEKETVIEEKNVVITEQAETIANLEKSVEEKTVEIEELLLIAEEYADMLFQSATESEVE